MLNIIKEKSFLTFLSRFKSTVQKINKPVLLLLALFCMNLGYCAFYKIASNDFSSKIEFTKQPKLVTSNGSVSVCSLNDAAVKISMMEISRSSVIDFAAIGLLLSMITVLPGSILPVFFKFYKKRSSYSLSPVPLFLQHRRLII